MIQATTSAAEVEYVREAGHHTDQLAVMFADAFKDDPGLQYLCQRQKSNYEQRLLGWFRAMLRLQVQNNQPLIVVKSGSEYVAAATLTAPQASLKFVSLLRWVVDALWGVGLVTLWRTMTHIQHISSYQPATPHFRLEFIGVLSSQQGKGIGPVLLAEVHRLSETHATAAGVWLETANPANVQLYQRFGYEITQQEQLGDEVTTTIMFRTNVIPVKSISGH